MVVEDVNGARPRVLLLLDGQMDDAVNRAKFGIFVEELSAQVDLVGVHDLTLRGVVRGITALVSWRPDRNEWREHYRKNPLTFALRSRQIQRRYRQVAERPDVILQVGAMSHPPRADGVPTILYLDFTFALTRREWPARAPMTAIERRIWRRQELSTYRDAAAILTRSEHTARSLIVDYRMPQSKVTVVGAGTNIRLPEITDACRADPPRVVYIGSDFLRKGGDVLLRAWTDVLRRAPDARLVMFGPVPTPLPPNVEVRTGWNRDAIARELAMATVFVMPSRCETWGDAFIEAMAFGVPCVGTTMDAMPEIIQDGVTGFVVPRDNASALADRMAILLTEPERAAQFSAAARQAVEERFLWRHTVARMVPVIESVRRAANASRT